MHQKPMHITLFGGSFDPPHLGHLFVIKEALELIPHLDELWLLPTHQHTFAKQLTPAPYRLKMCQLLIQETQEFQELQDLNHPPRPVSGEILPGEILPGVKLKLCPIEIDFKLSGQTYHTLKKLETETEYLQKTMFPETKADIRHTSYSFLMGSDQIPAFHHWGQHQQLLQKMQFFVYPRANHPYQNIYPQMKLLESDTQTITNLSSTLIKHRLQHHLSTKHLLPLKIHHYLTTQKLYQHPQIKPQI